MNNKQNKWQLSVLTAVTLLLTAAAYGFDQESVALARNEAQTFRPTTNAGIEKSKAAIRQRIATLEAFLATIGENGKRWRTYLMVSQLTDALNQPVPEDEFDREDFYVDHLDQVANVLLRFTAHHAGLDLPKFSAVKDVLDDYVQSLDDVQQPDLQEDFQNRMNQLVTLLENWSGSLDQYESLGEHQRWLTKRRQAPSLRQRIHKHFQSDNVIVTIAEPIITSVVDEPIDRVEDVNRSTGGARVRGSAKVTGEVKASLVENSEKAVVRISTSVLVNADNLRATSGPVTIITDGRVTLSAEKQLYIDATGLHSKPAEADADAQTRARAICTKFRRGGVLDRVVTKVARKQFNKKRAQSERESAQSARRDLEEQLDDEVKSDLGDVNVAFNEKFIDPLTRLGQLGGIAFRTTTSELFANILNASSNQLGAHAPAPAIGESKIGMQIHQSAINNVGRIIAGRTFQFSEITEMIEKLSDEKDKPEAKKEPDSLDDAAITFVDDNPLSVRFADNAVTATVRMKAFSSEGETYHDSMNVIVKYSIHRTDKGYELRLAEKPTVKPPAKAAMSYPLKNVLQKTLNRELEERIEIEPIDLPSPLDKNGAFEINQLDSVNGWIVVGLSNVD